MIKRALTALLSLEKPAYFGAAILLIAPFGNFVDKVLSKIIKPSDTTGQNDLLPVLFIVGPPRSGTTIVYQTLVQLLPSIYFSNLHAIIPNFASKCLKHSFGKFKSTKNYYGYTFGLNGVNEGNALLRSIYGDGRDRSAIRERFVKFSAAMQDGSHQVIIVKNVYSYNKLQLLMEVNPEIKVVQVHRSLLYASQSVYKAYTERGYFVPVPESLKNQLGTIDSHQFAVMLLMEIERQLHEQKQHVEKNRWFDLTYEEFCENPNKYAIAIKEYLGLADLVVNQQLNIKLKKSHSNKLSEEDMSKLKEFCERLQFR
jgi:hypothetical protein